MVLTTPIWWNMIATSTVANSSKAPSTRKVDDPEAPEIQVLGTLVAEPETELPQLVVDAALGSSNVSRANGQPYFATAIVSRVTSLSRCRYSAL